MPEYFGEEDPRYYHVEAKRQRRARRVQVVTVIVLLGLVLLILIGAAIALWR